MRQDLHHRWLKTKRHLRSLGTSRGRSAMRRAPRRPALPSGIAFVDPPVSWRPSRLVSPDISFIDRPGGIADGPTESWDFVQG
jgi:hypothetical protein